jgi:hypothetical protein
MNGFAGLPSDERYEYFVQTGQKMGLSPRIAEKDFWVCWVLEKLFALEGIGPALIFKGGTSLSKAYSLIERFSEDVDISISRESLGFVGSDCDPEESCIGSNERRRRIERLGNACRQKIAGGLLPAMTCVVESALGDRSGWELTIDEDDPDRQTLLYSYPSTIKTGRSTYIRPAVKIEMGARSDHWPSERVSIVPYVAGQFPTAFKAPSFEVKVLAPERTFWEKATLLHAEYHRASEKELPNRLSRHYYDTSRLIEAGLGERAMAKPELLARVVQHKKIFFQSGWANYDAAAKGSLRLAPPSTRMEALLEDYDNMKEMFFGNRPDFLQIAEVLAEWETAFNQGV